jgi:hypothetical protein
MGNVSCGQMGYVNIYLILSTPPHHILPGSQRAFWVSSKKMHDVLYKAGTVWKPKLKRYIITGMTRDLDSSDF